jgi:hypothetical protein
MVNTDGHKHNFKLEQYERGVMKGTCACGAVKFFASYFLKEYIERAKYLTKKEGREGNMETEIQVPPKPQTKIGNTRALKQYYETNREAIIADFNKLGEKAMLARWKISECGWTNMAVRWGLVKSETKSVIETDKPRVKTEKPISPPGVKVQDNPFILSGRFCLHETCTAELPPLPPFNDSWFNETKVKWLEVYGELVKSQKAAV